MTAEAKSGAWVSANDALRESEERFKGLYMAMAEGLANHDIIYKNGKAVDYIITAVNPAFEKITGLDNSAAVGKKASELYGTGAPPYLDVYARVAESGTPEHFETTFAPMQKSFAISVFSPGKGKFATVFSDITERKRLENDLRKNQLELQSLFNHSNAGLVLFDAKPPYTVLAHNKYYQELFAEPFKTEGMVGRNIYDYAPAVEAQGVVAVFDRVVRTKQPVDYLDFPYDSNPPEKSWFNWHLSPVLSDGEVVAFASMSINVTRQHEAEQALRDSESRFRGTLDNMLEGCQILDRDWRYVYINDTAERHNRRPRGELMGKRYMDMWPGIESTNLFAVIRRCMEERTTESLENEFTFPNGSIGWFDLTIQPVPEGVFILSMDVTARKKNTAELQTALAELKSSRRAALNLLKDAMEARRIAEEAEGALYLSAEDLERSNKDLEQFAYVASHDLQEPLRAVGGFMGLLKKQYYEKLDAHAQEYINFAVEGAERMQTLINDLLTFSRVGTRGGAFTIINMKEAVDRALKNLLTTIAETDTLVTCGAMPNVHADLSQMTQLLQNLIGNAIKFHGPRRPEVRINAGNKGSVWEFTVSDNGIGIEPQYYDRIFLIFQRLHTRSQYKGTGIGLAVCKKIVERHGGKLWVESRFGEGSTFFFTLPERRN